jgi:valyl-tRNA synthetase
VSEQFKLSKTFDPQKIEKDISRKWLDSELFHAVPDERPPAQRYVIMMPLPNVTGALHMGHAIDNVMQDLLIRWHRMLGDNTLWMPGTDHASIATQAVVEKRLKELEGKTRHDVGRKGLLERIWQWTEKSQKRIIAQQQRMGCSADWKRQRFTMDKVCARAVRHTFFRMFKDGLIFRGKRLVNWDPYLRTSISDDEVYHETVKGHFWHLKYPVNEPGPQDPAHVVVATTRPETMLGDTAVAVHPDPEKALDEAQTKLREALAKASAKERAGLKQSLAALEERKRTRLAALLHLRDMARAGKRVRLPLLDRPIPLILDEWAKPTLGSGVVKITPAHDPNDYAVWQRHTTEIDIINILNPDGTLNENAGPYNGLDRYAARDRVVADLDAQNLLGAVEDRDIEIGHSDRSKTPIEPYLSDQWFIHMGDVDGGVVMGRDTEKQHQSPGLVQAAMDAVTSGRVRFHPERFIKTYLDWLAEKRDWPISRQLWWGHRIPVWSCTAAAQNAVEKARTAITGPLADLFPSRAAVRLVHTDSQTAISVAADSAEITLPPTAQNSETPWRVDVCLLEDDGQALTQLAALGFAQDPDVLDTWFSSALWPHSTLGWPDPQTADTEGGAPLGSVAGRPDCLSYYYPGSCLVTARDIITLWVARMVLAGLYNLGDIPFTDVFIHANILDGKGERMSKSKGNGIDPVDIIEEYGTDAMRYVLCDMQTGNQDIRLPVTAICPKCENHNDLAKLKHGKSVFTYLCAGCKTEFDVLGTMEDLPSAKLISERFMDGKRFCNKLWNTARFALGNLEPPAYGELAVTDLALEDRWILAALNNAVRAVDGALADYNPSGALGAARDFMWGELCDWYLELIKPRLADPDTPSARVARQILAHCLDQTLRLLHPFVPFITEHLYGRLQAQVPKRGLAGICPVEEQPAALLIGAPWPTVEASLDDDTLREVFADLQAITGGIREARASQGISPKQKVTVTLRPPAARAAALAPKAHVIEHMANVETLHVDPQATRPAGSASLVVGALQIFVHDLIDDQAERERLQKELVRVEKEIAICQKKLANEKFVSRAPPQIVAEQREREAKYSAQKQAIARSLAELS